MNILKIDLSNVDIDKLETHLINNYRLYELKKIDYYILENWQNLSMQDLSLYMSNLKYILGGYNESNLKKRKYLLVKDINNLNYISDLCENYNYDLLYDGSYNFDINDLKELCKYPCTFLIKNSDKSNIIKQLLLEEFETIPSRLKFISYIPENNDYYIQDKFLNKFDLQNDKICYYNIDGNIINEIKCKDFSSRLNRLNYINEDKDNSLWFYQRNENYESEITNNNSKFVNVYIKAKPNCKTNIRQLYVIVKEIKRILDFVGEYERKEIL